MDSPQNSKRSSNVEVEEDDMLQVMQLSGLRLIPSSINTAKELDLFEIMAKARPLGTHLSPLYLASVAAPKNPDASMMIDRLLRLLTAYSVCTCKLVKDKEGREFRTYGLGKLGKTLIQDEDGFSMAPYAVRFCSEANGGDFVKFTEFIREGGASPWDRARGKMVFDNMKENENLMKIFNEVFTNHTSIVMKKILENYNGFENMSGCILVDVGGCLGTSLAQILSKYPLIKGVNFDLPHTVKEAPQIQGVEHIGGNMFVEIPRGDAIMMKWILHDWNDEKCVDILTNCKKALPETGKIIVIEEMVPREIEDNNLATKVTLLSDVTMMTLTNGGRERTKEEFEDLAIKAGFKLPKITYGAYSFWIIELYPN